MEIFMNYSPLFYSSRQESEADRAEVARLHEEMCAKIPLDALYARRVWRDKRLAALAKLKRELDKAE
jgi:hypothetical protein